MKLNTLIACLLLCLFYAASSWAQVPPSISLEMTLIEDTNGMVGDECGTQNTLTVGAGADVEVCYTVTNTGQTTLNLHDLVDTQLGTIITNFSIALAPGGSVWLTETVTATVNNTYNATWTAYNPGPTNVVMDSSSATLTVIPPSISLEMTLTEDTNGMVGDECGTQSTLSVGAGTDVEVCYTVTNTGQTTLNLHDLVDTQLGTIITNFSLALVPGASVWLTETVTATADNTYNATWTAFNAGPTNVVMDSSSATLTVIPPSISLEMTLTEDTNGMVGDECGTQSTLSVGAGTDVEVCYTVTNTGQTTLNLHDLVDTQLGTIITNFSLALVPGASVWLTETVTATADNTYNATWTAFNAGPTNVVMDSSSVTLTVIPPSISLEMTLMQDTNGLPGDDCGTDSTLSVPIGATVEVCYLVTNTGQTTLNLHDLVDSQFGTILNDFSLALIPGASVWLTQTVIASVDTTYMGTWTAFNAGPINVAADSGSATLSIDLPVAVPVPTLSPVMLWLMVGLMLVFAYRNRRLLLSR